MIASDYHNNMAVVETVWLGPGRRTIWIGLGNIIVQLPTITYLRYVRTGNLNDEMCPT